MKATREQFNQLVRDLVGPFTEADPWIFDIIEKAYSGERRHYHTLEHIGWGLKRLDDMADEDRTRGSKFAAREWDLIRFAWWFHDFVNEGDHRDEAESAEEAEAAGARIGLSSSDIAKVVRLILATDHKRIPLAWDAAVICDVDLSILGAEPEDFARYEEQIRQEWAHVPDELFAAARFEIMKRFAARPWIYMTEYGRTRWQRRARANLQRYLLEGKT